MLPRPALPQRRQSWTSLGASAAVHGVVFALLLAGSTREPPAGEADPERPAAPRRQVDMVYLPPPPTPPNPPPAATPPPPPRPPQPPSPPPPEQRRPEPEDRANARPEEVRSAGEETDQPEGASDPDASPEARRTEARRTEVSTMESEALRIFGRQRIATRPGAGPRAVRPMESYLPDDPDRCVPVPRPAADSAGEVQYGIVVGRIFREDGARPLPGAHLQMLGTPYVAFTDGEGEYRFRFDLALVENCRTQYVRVSARGYESRLLVLVVGPNVRSEDVTLAKRWPGL